MHLLAALALSMAIPQTPVPSSRMNMTAIHEAIAAFVGVVGLAVRNLDTGEEMAVNGDMRFPTASAIKTAVMIEAWHQASEGTLPIDTVLTLRESDKVGGSGVLNGMSDGLALKVRDLIHLMIVLSDPLLVDEDQLRNDGAGAQLAVRIEIRDIANDQAVAVERDRVAALDELSQVGIMTDQFPKH